MHADLAFAGLARHAELIAAGEISSRELTELFLSRIARLDPLLNAYRVVLGAEALAEADAADARRSGPAERRPDRDQGRHARRRPGHRPTAATPTRSPGPPTPRWSRACAPPAP